MPLPGIPAPKSIFKRSRKVLPGHYLVALANSIREVQYWDISFGSTLDLTEEEWSERLLETYREAVRLDPNYAPAREGLARVSATAG